MYLPSNNVKVFPIANRSIDGANTLTESNLTFLSRSLSMGSNGFVCDLIENTSSLDISFNLAGYSFKIAIPKSELSNATHIYAGIDISDKGQIQGVDDENDGKYTGLYISTESDYQGDGVDEYLLIAEKNDGNWKIPIDSLFINQLITGIDGKR